MPSPPQSFLSSFRWASVGARPPPPPAYPRFLNSPFSRRFSTERASAEEGARTVVASCFSVLSLRNRPWETDASNFPLLSIVFLPTAAAYARNSWIPEMSSSEFYKQMPYKYTQKNFSHLVKEILLKPFDYRNQWSRDNVTWPLFVVRRIAVLASRSPFLLGQNNKAINPNGLKSSIADFYKCVWSQRMYFIIPNFVR